MPRFGPIGRRDLIRYLKDLGFEGPYTGRKHQLMLKGDVTVRIPNPHVSDIGKQLLAQILAEAGIDRDTWEQI